MMTLERVDGAANASRSPVEDMGVDHRRLHIAMTQKLLDRSDIVTAFQQVSCEGMAKSVTVHVGQESVNSLFGHLRRMAHVVEIDKPLDPVAVSLLGSPAVMAGAQGLTQTVEKFRFLGRL